MTDTTTAADWRVETHRVAQRIRARVLEITLLKDGCYLSQALSSADVLAALYTRILKLAPLEQPLDSPAFAGVPGAADASPSGGRFHGEHGPDLDRFLISPAHYAVAIYAALESVGRLQDGALESFNTDGSTLEMIGAEHSPGFELTTGSFGQALSQSGGIAFARRLKGDTGRTMVFVSDGELEEGQTWEGVQAAAFYKLDRLVMFVDVNGQQVDGWTKDVMNIEPINSRFEAFGWDVATVDGHDLEAIVDAVETKEADGRPLVVLLYTDSAKGMPYLNARKPHLHYVRAKTEEDRREFEAALARLQEESR
ncbi:transketolase [Agrococcus baldri]|uniref:Transketolase n=1 Tax=Agrococcus baldri TaxID=153730 RepID=A0AA94HMN4_9MICO|nr:thiamine pyrophosphate-dependent enzyme [Agrococcus baldri]SFS11294.1 transketolase [Agrococcus baldri]